MAEVWKIVVGVDLFDEPPPTLVVVTRKLVVGKDAAESSLMKSGKLPADKFSDVIRGDERYNAWGD